MRSPVTDASCRSQSWAGVSRGENIAPTVRRDPLSQFFPQDPSSCSPAAKTWVSASRKLSHLPRFHSFFLEMSPPLETRGDTSPAGPQPWSSSPAHPPRGTDCPAKEGGPHGRSHQRRVAGNHPDAPDLHAPSVSSSLTTSGECWPFASKWRFYHGMERAPCPARPFPRSSDGPWT